MENTAFSPVFKKVFKPLPFSTVFSLSALYNEKNYFLPYSVLFAGHSPLRNIRTFGGSGGTEKTMRENVKVTASGQALPREAVLRAVLTHAAVAVCAFLSARAVIFGSLMPFGIAAAAGAPIIFAPAVAAGVFIGYIAPASGFGAFRYLAAVFAVLAVRLLIGGDRRLSKNKFFLGMFAFFSSLLTSFVTYRGARLNVAEIITEAALAGAGTVFICIASAALLKENAGLSGDELAALLVCISFILIGADSMPLGDIAPGRVLSVLLILICGKYGGLLAGAAAGAAVSFSAFIASGRNAGFAAVYALAGVAGGIWSRKGKYAQLLAVGTAVGIGALASGGSSETVMRIIELLAGSVLFLLLPRGASIPLGKLFSAYPQIITPSGVKKAVTLRLQLASGALEDVSDTVEQVSAQLSRINAPDYGEIIERVEQDACAGCRLRVHCWETRRADTLEALLQMTREVKSGAEKSETGVSADFRARCARPERLEGSVRRHYEEYASAAAAENRLEEVRSVVSDQFSGISRMLSDLAVDLEREEKFDSSGAAAAAEALRGLGITAEECSCCIDRFGRMTVKARLKKSRDLILNKRQVMKALSLACERDFDIPAVSEVGGDVFITVGERAVYSVQLGVHQISAFGARLCGDAYRSFNDGKGHFTVILSDGMGTGGRAAVDGAMASGLMSRLLRSGFGYDCSLKMLNSAMLFKSTDESLATVDIVSIDLHSGSAELFKAGAAPTLLRRSGRSGKAESRSLPAGILRDIGFDRAAVKLKAGDIVLMMSDGAVSEGTDWIRDELTAWQDGSADDLAEHICTSAHRRRSDSHEDDITVIAIMLQKS